MFVKNPGDVSAGAQLTTLGNNEDPAWSPDGTRIAFVSDRAGIPDLYVMDADGSDQTRLTFEAVEVSNPAWSPDGARIAFDGNNVSQDIVVVNANGSGRGVVAGGGDIQNSPAWTADGARIVFRDFSQGTGLSSVAADGTGRVPLIADASQPDVSPDGARIAFVRGGQIATAGIDGGGAAPVTTMTGSQPAFSPDGTLIVYSRFDGGSLELFTVPVGGGPEIKETLTAMGVHDTDADWQAIAPAPDVTALSRPVAGSPGATLTIDGTGFVRRSVVRWNGADRPTTFVNAGRLTAQLGAADVASPGTAQVTVFTSPAGGGLSVARTATVDPPPPPPALAVTSVRVRATWARSRVRGAVRVRGTAERAGRVEAALLAGRGRAARVVARRRATLGPGVFLATVPLPRTLLPGRLTVRLREVGPVSGAALTEATATALLAAPREGVVRRAFVSALQNGPPVRRLRAGRRLFAHFRFAALPRAGLPLTAAWTHDGRPAGVAVRKPRARGVVAFIGAPGGRLPAGRYRCTLRAGRVVVAVAAVRVV